MLGKDREREHARVLSGDVELTSAIIDSSRFAKKYTSGCLSFAEADLSDDAKKQIMADYEHCLFQAWLKISTTFYGLNIATRDV